MLSNRDEETEQQSDVRQIIIKIYDSLFVMKLFDQTLKTKLKQKAALTCLY